MKARNMQEIMEVANQGALEALDEMEDKAIFEATKGIKATYAKLKKQVTDGFNLGGAAMAHTPENTPKDEFPPKD